MTTPRGSLSGEYVVVDASAMVALLTGTDLAARRGVTLVTTDLRLARAFPGADAITA